jgi:hypothetical protein
MIRPWGSFRLSEESNDLLSEPWMRGSYHGCLFNSFVREQAFFDLRWGNVLAS